MSGTVGGTWDSRAGARAAGPLAGLVSLDDVERRAHELLEPGPLAFFAGGAGDEHTMAEGRAAWQRWHLLPRMLVDVSGTTTRTTVLGREISMPVLVAPFSLCHLAHPDGVRGVARAAAAAGTIACISTLADASPGQCAQAAPGGARWFQAYWYGKDKGLTRALVELAAAAGCEAIALTVDTPRLSRRERDLRAGWLPPADMEVPSLREASGGALGRPADLIARLDDTTTWRDFEELAAWSPIPVVAKGVLHPEDARIAAASGARAVIVSTHGGRQLDETPAALDLLPECVDAVAGAAEVLLDSGVRRGSHVVKALALGARAVLVGRPAVWGLAVAGEAGVAHVLETLRVETDLCLALLGATSPAAVGREHLRPAAGR